VIHVKDHDFFKREGEHLLCEIPVSFVQAALATPSRSLCSGTEAVRNSTFLLALSPEISLASRSRHAEPAEAQERGSFCTGVSENSQELTSRQKSFSKNMPEARVSRNRRNQEILAENLEVAMRLIGPS